MNPPDYHALVDAIYAGILSPDGFNRGLQIVKDAFGVELSYLLLWLRSSDLIRFVGAAGITSEFQTDYESHYQFKDPTKNNFAKIPAGDWWIDTHQLGLARLKSSAFHQEFLRSYDMASFMVSPIFRSAETEVALGLLGSRTEGVFTQARALEIQPYIPHIRRAVLLGPLIKAISLTRASPLFVPRMIKFIIADHYAASVEQQCSRPGRSRARRSCERGQRRNSLSPGRRGRSAVRFRPLHPNKKLYV